YRPARRTRTQTQLRPVDESSPSRTPPHSWAARVPVGHPTCVPHPEQHPRRPRRNGARATDRVAGTHAYRPGQLFRRCPHTALHPVPTQCRGLALRYRPARQRIRGRVRNRLPSPLHPPTPRTTRSSFLLRTHRQGGKHLETAVGHGISLLSGRWKLPTVDRPRHLRHTRSDSHPGCPDARRPEVSVDRT